MHRRMSWLAWLAAMGVCAGSAAAADGELAEPGQGACGATGSLSGAQASWTAPNALAAGGTGGAASAAKLAIGHASRVTLLPSPQVDYVLRPGKPGASSDFGGLLQVNVSKAGQYAVALSSAAWVDLVRGKRAVDSIGHRRGPACSGIHKVVDFRLLPGRYILQIAANGEPQVTVLVSQAD